MNKTLSWLSFILGAIIVAWMGTAFMGTNPLALIITVAIAAIYVLGFSELMGYQRDSLSLRTALDKTQNPVEDLPVWLNQLAPSLQQPVEQRITQERSAIPTPALAPYLIGLLVMLGLIGTFIGMVDTLKGAVIALESNDELEAIRSGLAAPMKGLGMAFGTSVAGVSASAALGLISTLSRRDRLSTWRLLEAAIGPFFSAHAFAVERQRTFAAIQDQAQQWPNLLDRLALLSDRLENLGSQVCDTLTQQQQNAIAETARCVSDMTRHVQSTLQEELTTTTERMGALVEPVVERVLTQGQEQLTQAQSQWQADNQSHLASQLETLKGTTTDLQQYWQTGMDEQHKVQKALAQQQVDWASHSQQLIDDSITQTQKTISTQLNDWLEQQRSAELTRQQMADTAHQQWLSDMAAGQAQNKQLLEQQARWAESLQQQITTGLRDNQTALGDSLEQWLCQQQEQVQQHNQTAAATQSELFASLAAQHEQQSNKNNELANQLNARVQQIQSSLADQLQTWLDHQQNLDHQRREEDRQSNQSFYQTILEQQRHQTDFLAQQNDWVDSTQGLIKSNLLQTQSDMHTAIENWLNQQSQADQARLDAIQFNNQSQFDTLLKEHRQHAEAITQQQQNLINTMATVVKDTETLLVNRNECEQQWQTEQRQTTQSLLAAAQDQLTQLREDEAKRNQANADAYEQLHHSMAKRLDQLTQTLQQPMTELMDAAAQSPKAAAQVISQLRQEMSSALQRDNELLQERQSVMAQLDQLASSLAASSNEQREAVMGMAQTSTQVLAEVGDRFTAKIDADIERLSAGMDAVAASSIEMNTLAETFAVAVNDYQTANQQLLDHFSSLETQIAAMNDRSDEQMGYYVAQAREIIDHSLSSQQEMIEQIRRLGRTAAETE